MSVVVAVPKGVWFPSLAVARQSLPKSHFLVQVGNRVKAVGDVPDGIREVEFVSEEVAGAYLEAAKCYLTLVNGAHVVWARREPVAEAGETVLLPVSGSPSPQAMA